MQPHFEETHCPRCGDSDGVTSDEAVQLVLETDTDGNRTRLIWCAKGHVTAIVNDVVTISTTIDGNPVQA